MAEKGLDRTDAWPSVGIDKRTTEDWFIGPRMSVYTVIRRSLVATAVTINGDILTNRSNKFCSIQKVEKLMEKFVKFNPLLGWNIDLIIDGLRVFIRITKL